MDFKELKDEHPLKVTYQGLNIWIDGIKDVLPILLKVATDQHDYEADFSNDKKVAKLADLHRYITENILRILRDSNYILASLFEEKK